MTKTVASSMDKEETTSPVVASSSTGDVKDFLDRIEEETKKEESQQATTKVPVRIVWRNVILMVYLHAAAPYGLYLMFTSAMWQTNLLAFVLYKFSALGVTAGPHRLWTHRSYKARLPLRIFLAFIFTMAFQNDILDWSRDHRVHHKYSETDADPHNAKRGFFFSHIGWLLSRKHPDVIKKGKQIELGDLKADPVVRFQRKYYIPLLLLCCFVFPTITPMYLWGETLRNSFFVPTLFRLCFTYHITWLVNSAAHMWGNRPYDVNINPRENLFVSLGANGEGFHNYHHTFPYDYSTSEHGTKYNLTTAFINAMSLLGLAYDLKTVPKTSINARKMKTGSDSVQNPTEAHIMGNKVAYQVLSG